MEYWSWVLAVVGMTGVYLTTLKKTTGFMIGLGVQVLWIIFAVTTQQYGFIFSAVGFGVMNTLGLIRWRRSSHEHRNGGDPRDS